MSPTKRLTAIFRRWRGAERRSSLLFMEQGSPAESLGSICLLTAIGLLPLVGIVDGALIYGGIVVETARPALLGFAVALVAVAQGWQIDRLFTRATRAQAEAAPWLLLVRRLIGCAPLVGWMVIPAWRLLERVRPGWAFREPREGGPHLAGARPPLAGHWMPRLGPDLAHPVRRFLALWIGSVVLLCTVAAHLLAGLGAGDPLVVTMAVAVHGLGFSCMLVRHLIEGAAGRSGAAPARWRLPFALPWLLPFPGPLVSFASELIDTESAGRESTLVARSVSERAGAGRHETWAGLRHALRSSWPSVPWRERLRGRSPEVDGFAGVGSVEANVGSLSRFRALTQLCDATLLGWALCGLAELPGGEVATAARAALAVGTLAVGLAGTGGMLAVFVAGWLRVRHSKRRRPGGFSTSLAATQLATLCGLFLGEALHRQDLVHFGGVLAVAAGSAALVLTLPRILSIVVDLPAESPEEERRHTLWSLGFASAGILGLALARPTAPVPMPPLLWLNVAAVSASGVVVGVRRLPWLLHPWSLRQVFDPALPLGRRAALAALAASAVVPMGGVIIPWWNRLRRATPRPPRLPRPRARPRAAAARRP